MQEFSVALNKVILLFGIPKKIKDQWLMCPDCVTAKTMLCDGCKAKLTGV
jgi:hypothetical protein